MGQGQDKLISQKLESIGIILKRLRPKVFGDIISPRLFSRTSFADLKSRWQEHLASLKEKGDHEEIDLYIHIPFCKTRCKYCQYQSNKLKDPHELAEYLEYLKQTAHYFNEVFRNTEFCNVYVGGGTPNILSEMQIKNLFKSIFSELRLKAGDYQRTFEMHPLLANREKLRLIREAGFNRVSFGIQTFNRATLDKEGRGYVSPDYLNPLVNYAKELGFNIINVDFIVGLNDETEEDVLENLRLILKVRPTSLVFYALHKKLDTSSLYQGDSAEFYNRIYEIDKKIQIEGQKNGYSGELNPQQIGIGYSMNLRPSREFLSTYEAFSTSRRSIFCLGQYASGSIFGSCRYEIIPLSDYKFDGRTEAINLIHMDRAFQKWHFIQLSLYNDRINDAEFSSNFGQTLESAYPLELAYLLDKRLLENSAGDYVFIGGSVENKFLCCLLFLDLERLNIAK